MNKLAKKIRTITISPAIAFFLILFIFIFKNSFLANTYSYIIALTTLIILPIIAYPIQRRFNIIKNPDQRYAERKLAIIFSVIGYLIGFILSLILKTPITEKVLYSTYLLSAILIFVFSFIFKINASGHMAGIAGPIAVVIYYFSNYYLLLCLLLMPIIWSSLKLKRHSHQELVLGTFIPIIALIISILIF